MPIMYYIQNSVLGIVLISILLFYATGGRGKRQIQDSLFVGLLVATLAVIVFEFGVDVLSGTTFLGSRVSLKAVTCIFFVVCPLPGCFYFLYLDQLRRRWDRIPTAVMLILLVFMAPVLFLSISSIWNGRTFFIDSSNVYHRGEFLPLMVGMNFAGLIGGLVYLCNYREDFRDKDFSLFLFFPLPAIVGGILQAKFYGIELTGICIALTLLIVFLQMQNMHANKDYLTMLYNRSMSERYLSQLIHKRKKVRSIAGIMLDINDFKQVNDSFGHELGDRTLRSFSDVLIHSFKNGWFIARYGGDEFILFKGGILEDDLARDLARFANELNRFNKKGDLPFPVSASIGATLFEIDDKKDASAMFRTLDALMYQEKQRYHAHLNLEFLG